MLLFFVVATALVTNTVGRGGVPGAGNTDFGGAMAGSCMTDLMMCVTTKKECDAFNCVNNKISTDACKEIWKTMYKRETKKKYDALAKQCIASPATACQEELKKCTTMQPKEMSDMCSYYRTQLKCITDAAAKCGDKSAMEAALGPLKSQISALCGGVPECPDGWEHYADDNTCLKATDASAHFDQARQTCQKAQGDLVTIRDEKKGAALNELLLRGRGVYCYWVGVHDANGDGEFEYLDGSPLTTYQPWLMGGPNRYSQSGPCVLSVSSGSSSWMDHKCDRDCKVVCEMDLSKPPEATTVIPAPSITEMPTETEAVPECPEGWMRYGDDNTCLKASLFDAHFDQARQVCQNAQGDLVTIRDEKKGAAVNEILMEGVYCYWIGVHDANGDGEFEYIDGSPLTTFHPWLFGEPNKYTHSGRCVLSLSSSYDSWMDFKCDRKCKVVCEMDLSKQPDMTTKVSTPSVTETTKVSTPSATETTKVSTPSVTETPTTVSGQNGTSENPTAPTKSEMTTATPTPSYTEKPTPTESVPVLDCPDGWSYYAPDNTCLIRSRGSATFDGARSTCQRNQGDVVMINDEAKADHVYGMLGHVYCYWVGIYDANNEGTFKQLDGSPLTSFQPWAHGEPNNFANNEHCVHAIAKTSKWNDIGCDFSCDFVCEMKSSKKSGMKSTSAVPTPAITITEQPKPTEMNSTAILTPSVTDRPEMNSTAVTTLPITEQPVPECPEGWKYFAAHGRCYWLPIYNFHKKVEAQNEQRISTEIPTVATTEEPALITKSAPECANNWKYFADHERCYWLPIYNFHMSMKAQKGN